ncbi:MAG: hypothetical protein U9N11_06885 [Campylobacterota bacterium]|nr:hypothetical protein [Campylobacterota bacterium]
MRQNHRHFFHKAIIASLCCMVLASCGHKTNPEYIPTEEEIAEAKKKKALRIANQNVEQKVSQKTSSVNTSGMKQWTKIFAQ